MWILGAVMTLVGVGVFFWFPNLEGYVYGIPYGHRFGLADIVNMAVCGVVGFWGNDWRASSLVDRWFEKVTTEHAATPDGAKAAYLRRAATEHQEPSFVRREPV
jgi:hypothetical protein